MEDPKTLKIALRSAYACLESNRKLLNSLNVFPVPDGDTGDNMCMTFKSGLDKIEQADYTSSKEMTADFALACLMGARGNSGVILSLAVKGFAESFSTGKTNGEIIANGFKNAVDFCYKSVSSPKEGTALTLLRACADKAAKSALKDKSDILNDIYYTAEKTVAKTKELLPELKEANVVDAGAKGLLCIIDGIRYFENNNEPYRLTEVKDEQTNIRLKQTKIENKYCCECVIKGETPISTSKLEKLGDSAISVFSNDIIKIHVHSNFPDRVLSLALCHGEILNVKVENMQCQHSKTEWDIKKKYAFIAVCSGDGIAECYSQLGCDKIINTREKVSAGKLLKSIEQLNAETIYLLPNDKNNFLAFEQAAKMTKQACVIIKTSDQAQGIGVLMSFDNETDEKDNTDNMKTALSEIRTGCVCTADKNLGKIKKGDSIGIISGNIAVSEKDSLSCVEKVVEKLFDKDYNDISVFCGESINAEERKKLKQRLETVCLKAEINIINGGQNIYDFIVLIS